MKPNLSGVRAKLSRAYEHLGALEQEIAHWVIGDGHDIVAKFHPATAQPGIVSLPSGYGISLEVTDRSALERVAILAGDCIHNLRTALDHLAWQLVLVRPGTPDEKTAFPIFDEMIVEVKRRRRTKHKPRPLRISGGVTVEALTLIESAQPYQRIDDPTLHPLWFLDQLENIDKHRTLNVLAAMVANSSVSLTDPRRSFLLHQSATGKAFKEGTPMAWFPVTTPIPDVIVEVNHSIHISFSGFQAIEAQPIDEVLRELTDYTAQLLDCFRMRFFPNEDPLYRPPLF